jgi:tetratricopeptide (TPR) repeat protein
MPMRESLQLAGALAARHDRNFAGADWRPLLRYAAGNPLTITVLVGQALRGNLTTTEAIEAFVARLRAGEAQLEVEEDAALGRARSLAASLSYGFAQAFTTAERAQLAVLHLFRDTVGVDALRYMGDPRAAGEDAVPELTGFDRGTGIALLDRAAGIGLLTSLGSGPGYYQIHPALPWYFTTLYTTTYGQTGDPAAQHATRAYTQAVGALGHYYLDQAEHGHAAEITRPLRAEEANLRHALGCARAAGLWDAAVGCLQGLRVLYEQTGRDSEWAKLVDGITPDFTDPATGRPVPGREDQWSIITGYQVRLAWQARDWATATTLQNTLIAWDRDQAAAALGVPPASLTPGQRNQIRSLAVSLQELGQILRDQADPGCLPYYQEALGLLERVGESHEEAELAINLGNAYLAVPGLRDLDQGRALVPAQPQPACTDNDRAGRAKTLNALGTVALRRFWRRPGCDDAEPVLLKHWSAALHSYQQALDLTPADDHELLGSIGNQLGIIYRRARDTRQALRHYQQSIQHKEARGDICGAGQTRYNIALLLDDDGRTSDALLYARAALANFQQAGPGATTDTAKAEWLITRLQQRSH